MEFSQPKGIYQQIADQVCERILSGEWAAEERIPSVRELAVDMGVNPNTVARSYQSLVDDMHIENRRGIGYFVIQNARERILENMKNRFINMELPRLFRTMQKLGIKPEEIVQRYEQFSQSVQVSQGEKQ
ncbi:MAG: hypothetical protein B0D92_06760 [Spirochaeta sp. LUC14_002_19_P3]|nr:MAG: hypothetical protein B0D92_06760 [Spirochaeta sp. LUC14_002_19_P3]